MARPEIAKQQRRPIVVLSRAQLLELAQQLAAEWAAASRLDGSESEAARCQGGRLRRAVLARIATMPADQAVAIAVVVAAELDQLFQEGARFRAALVLRAVGEE